MVQGTTKLAQKKSSGGRSGAAKDMKKGRRVIPPKAQAAVQHHLIRKNLSAKINNSIEKQMVAAASSGKLTIMKHVAGDTRPESWSKKVTEAKKAGSGASASKKL